MRKKWLKTQHDWYGEACSGVLQGSVIEPLLLYINDLVDMLDDNFLVFVVDVKYIYPRLNFESLSTNLFLS